VIKGIHDNVLSSQIKQAFNDHNDPWKPDWKNIQVNDDDTEATKNLKTIQNLFFINLYEEKNYYNAPNAKSVDTNNYCAPFVSNVVVAI